MSRCTRTPFSGSAFSSASRAASAVVTGLPIHLDDDLPAAEAGVRGSPALLGTQDHRPALLTEAHRLGPVLRKIRQFQPGPVTMTVPASRGTRRAPPRALWP